jgi:DNA polymerase-3 subunit chi
MADINFYHLTRSTIKQALPKLLEKILASNTRGLVVAVDKTQTEDINSYLWSSTRAFLPHGSDEDAYPEHQPLYLTYKNDNPNGAKVLVLVGGADYEGIEQFEKCLVLFDGNDAAFVPKVRKQWKHYQELGFPLIYWQQDEQGKWKKAN